MIDNIVLSLRKILKFVNNSRFCRNACCPCFWFFFALFYLRVRYSCFLLLISGINIDWINIVREGKIYLCKIGATVWMQKDYRHKYKNNMLLYFYVQWFELRGDCSLCWYWWICWPSLFKLSFHKYYKEI